MIDRAEIIRSDAVARAAEVLREGGLVGFPTETVYGLGADAGNRQAIERLFAVKGRPVDHPVIVHLASADQMDGWACEITASARLLAQCWPAPLTIVVRRASHVLDGVTGGLDTVGLRVPAQPVALELLGAFGGGIAAPSANRFGRVSPTTAAAVETDLGDDVDFVLDGGPCAYGVESTIVDCTGDGLEDVVLLRPGGVVAETIEGLLGHPVRARRDGDTRAPGTLASHYAPRAVVELITEAVISERVRELAAQAQRVGLLAMNPPPEVNEFGIVVLRAPSDVDDFARVLYARLREADQHGLDTLLVVPPLPIGIGVAVLDRLGRAATQVRLH